jgi:hypothetical protein
MITSSEKDSRRPSPCSAAPCSTRASCGGLARCWCAQRSSVWLPSGTWPPLHRYLRDELALQQAHPCDLRVVAERGSSDWAIRLTRFQDEAAPRRAAGEIDRRKAHRAHVAFVPDRSERGMRDPASHVPISLADELRRTPTPRHSPSCIGMSRTGRRSG